jgi:hypothetical protein
MKKNVIATLGVLVIFWAFACAGLAADLADSVIKVKSSGNISYVSGGVGLEERDALAQMSRDYNLKLNFAVSSGNYLGDVSVVITDARGQVVLEAVSEGPWFFAKLPSGKYTIRAEVMGKAQQQSSRVPAKGQAQVNFFWKG